MDSFPAETLARTAPRGVSRVTPSNTKHPFGNSLVWGSKNALTPTIFEPVTRTALATFATAYMLESFVIIKFVYCFNEYTISFFIDYCNPPNPPYIFMVRFVTKYNSLLISRDVSTYPFTFDKSIVVDFLTDSKRSKCPIGYQSKHTLSK